MISKGKESPNFKDRTGEKYTTNEGYEITIIACRGNRDCDIKFTGGHILTGINYAHMKKGNIKNPYHKSVFGVGYFGTGKYKSKSQDKHTIEYRFWKAMMERGYSKSYSDKQSSYKDVTVCDEWHNFQNFAKWFENNYNPDVMEGFALDKDILIKGNKIYSPKTCCFVPQEVNNLFKVTKSCRGEYPVGVHLNNKLKIKALLSKKGKQEDLGTFKTPEEAFKAYKTAKEEWIKIMADKWRGQITEPCYEAMCNYKVEITD